nr:hypothetical protein M03F4.1 - Caenorhabditis elegans [Caenorhabditis elegans]
MSDPQVEQDDRDRAYSFMSSDSGVDTTPHGRVVREKPLKSTTTYEKYPPSGFASESTKSISFSSPGT